MTCPFECDTIVCSSFVSINTSSALEAIELNEWFAAVDLAIYTALCAVLRTAISNTNVLSLPEYEHLTISDRPKALLI